MPADDMPDVISRAAAPSREGVTVATEVTLDAPIEAVWREIRRPALLFHVTRGLMRFEAMEPEGWPEVWEAREYPARLKSYGFLPLGRQIIGIEFPAWDGETRFFRDRGRGDVCDVWDHLVTMTPLPGGRTRYRDQVRVSAGRLTYPVAAMAWNYYFTRQRRLKRLAARGFVY